MMTNAFTPHVGGVARSVQAFTDGYRKRGHWVLVVAPEYENMPEKEADVIRIPAIQHFNGSDFSVILPIPGFLTSAIEKFRPDIVHAHHPFLIGETALRLAHIHELPLVFTHHTMYEQYTHYVPADSRSLKRFVINLSTGYANLCDPVFAPSESVASTLINRGIEVVSIEVPNTELTRVASDHLPLVVGIDIPRLLLDLTYSGKLFPLSGVFISGLNQIRFAT